MSRKEHGVIFADDEIERVVRQTLDARCATLVLDFLDLTGDGRRTYADTARKYGLSRERIRQILGASRAKARPSMSKLKQLRRAVAVVWRFAPAPAASTAKHLRAAGVLSPSGSAAGILRAANWLGLARHIRLRTVSPSKTAVVVLDAGGSKARRIVAAARSVTAGVGVAELAAVMANLERRGVKANRKAVWALLEAQPGFQALVDGWFWFDNMRNRLVNYTAKALAVARGLKIGELRAALARHPRVRRGLPPKKVLSSFYAQHPSFSVVDGRVSAMRERDAQALLAGAERQLYRVLRDNGPELVRSEFRRLALEVGVKSSTFGLYVRWAPFIHTTRSGYALLRSLS